MIKKPEAETVFERFCNSNNIKWEKIKEGENAAPDYKVFFNGDIVYIEVKQIDKDDNFNAPRSSRTLGSHIREKIKEARRQVKAVSKQGAPAILLVYNNLDGLQRFGTSPQDFKTAMYGEMTLTFDKNENKFTDYFHGRNRSFSKDKSTYFSAVGFLYQTRESVGITLYENAHANAENKLNFAIVPDCIEVVRIELE
ncbi:MAG: hypothetical protein WA104_05500 [Thermodesulfovibrionales bacterium]